MDKVIIENIAEQLSTNQLAQFSHQGFEIVVRADGARLLLQTPVFYGGNYIPPSVRRALRGGTSLMARDTHSEACLWIDQGRFQVVLDYRVKGSRLASDLDEFLAVAEEWRTLLDEYGQQDLIHVPV